MQTQKSRSIPQQTCPSSLTSWPRQLCQLLDLGTTGHVLLQPLHLIPQHCSPEP